MGVGKYVCGVCGGRGHNRRSCGRVVARKGQVRVGGSAGGGSGAGVVGVGVSTVGDVFERFQGNVDADVGAGVGDTVEDEGFTAEDLQTWWALAEGKSGRKRRGAGEEDWADWDTDALLGVLSAVSDDEGKVEAMRDFLAPFGVRAKRGVAGRYNISPHLMVALAGDGSVETLRVLAARWDLPERVAQMLARVENVAVKKTLADNLWVSAQTLETLYVTRGRNGQVLPKRRLAGELAVVERIVNKPDCPDWILAAGLESDVEAVRMSALGNYKVPVSQVGAEAVRCRKSPYIRKLLLHPGVPGWAVDEAVRGFIVEAAARRRAGRRVVRSYREVSAVCAFVGKGGCSEATLRELYGVYCGVEGVWGVMVALVENDETPLDVVERIGEDSGPGSYVAKLVRERLARAC